MRILIANGQAQAVLDGLQQALGKNADACMIFTAAAGVGKL